jgi:hypothetical protein
LLRIFSAAQWEEMVLEWAHYKKDEYDHVELCAGARDMGRDVIGHVKGLPGVWDNFQCKHYAGALVPSEMWVEFGKLCYYTYLGAYTVPRRYVIVAPHGAGKDLSALLKDPVALKAGLIANWDVHCKKNKITKKQEIPLIGDLLKHVQNFDFSIVEAMSPLTLIEEHKLTPYFYYRFGGEYPVRPPVEPVLPTALTPDEAVYAQALFEVYTDHQGTPAPKFSSMVDLAPHRTYHEHFVRSRRSFFSAEALRTFTRDKFPPGHFESLQDQIHHGVADVAEDEHDSDFKRVKETTKQAINMSCSGHVLNSCLTPPDRAGICHQLINDGRLRWKL